jgi:hypothetical protein
MSGGCVPYSGEAGIGLLSGVARNFMTHADTLPYSLAFPVPVFALAKKQILTNYREVHAKILEDAARLATWTRKAAA